MADWLAGRRAEPLTTFLRTFTELRAWYAIGALVEVASVWLNMRGLRRPAVYVAASTAASGP